LPAPVAPDIQGGMTLPLIRIHDTLSRKKVELRPIEDEHVRMYACGPTVYDYFHLGNGRMFIVFDLVARHLRARGYQVTYARNITDIDDKIIRRAAELGEEPAQLAARFTDEFHKDVAALGCQPPDIEPRVTGTMPAILEMIETLIKKGLAYESAGDVYFAVQQFPQYGELSQKPIDELQAGARVEVSDKKRDPLDFALWKAAKPGEPSWSSPWGAGRPGWHIECSAMTWKVLGVEFDIHGGGVDLTFPHHENERAQSMGALGTFVRVWMHNGFINFGGGKISKSDESTRVLFNRAFKARVLIERHGGEAVRWFCLTTQYRNPVNFEVTVEGPDPKTSPLRFPNLEEAERRLEYGYLTLQRLRDQLAVGKPAGDGAVAPEAEAWLARLQSALDDDFNSAEALAALGEALALANRILDGKLDAPKDVKRRTLERLARDLEVASRELGLYEAEPAAWLAEHRARRCAAKKIDPAAVEARIAERTAARQAKDFARADTLRQSLATDGIEIMDTPRGTTWRVGD
jgi:cysteinyl-tRNA synthetase